ncbi:hypothetical protein IW492_05940 [Enterococcus sp. BWB1-3]|uniref:hypothetical protein n=1 Tax=Enterococcus sp. BWB1-3 TaxID=2787713 RepID=UPI001920A4D9|nr:hypothetical protein [Enterococcus sp. BWB1-3]MBL1228773.1 hypothetical protein [Enterococcus sp. BWB1-3]
MKTTIEKIKEFDGALRTANGKKVAMNESHYNSKWFTEDDKTIVVYVQFLERVEATAEFALKWLSENTAKVEDMAEAYISDSEDVPAKVEESSGEDTETAESAKNPDNMKYNELLKLSKELGLKFDATPKQPKLLKAVKEALKNA